MTFSVNVSAGPVSLVNVPANTSKNDILTGIKGSIYTLANIRALSSSGTTTVTLHFYDDSRSTEVDFIVLTASAAGTDEDLSPITLEENDVLRATASTADVGLLLSYAVRNSGNG